ncbi:helix-turn-helix transcriptional regulator [Geotalea sp. SG265]|uniref:helix-turn-helix transcriptional regulator n=1 Tax=Geotalea sp. SG265 TaxID=2922867 RepID=UPI001FB005C7|nr:helix-turn-helix transcriptional regulator [Geotalea sp. SG265]
MENLPDKIEKATSASVAIDGASIKSIRETKKLTQLYVANVVGVTTDTISRWENNRYPTIKRDNAEKLALALEVSLDEILRRESVAPAEEPPQVELPLPPKKSRRRVALMAVAIAALVGLGAYFILARAAAPAVAERWLPHYCAPGQLMPVQITVTRRDNTRGGLIVKEKLPSGWRLVNATPPAASAKSPSEEVRWLIAGGSGAVKISYVVQVPTDAPLNSQAQLKGTILVHSGGSNRAAVIGGSGKVGIAPFHWADGNGDGRIDDSEIMPAYYVTEEMKGLGLDWATIEAIWSGRGYTWNRERNAFEVVK